ncbi:MAG: NADH:flavin oxidoreductase [Planctomycetes bacterium]|nr:NADH:flavin oxidoreductase [Planctomycetota bacterium]
MARYFRYNSLDDLREDAAERGLEIPLSEDFAPLFEPIQIGRLRAGNRLVVHPMEGCDGTLDGRPDELTFRRWERFGAGGAKIIWGEATAVVPEGRGNPRQLCIHEGSAAAIAEMLKRCRRAHREACGSDDDLVVGLQLTHSGRYCCQRPLPAFHDPLLDPLTIADKSTGRPVDAGYPLLSDDGLKRLEDAYVAAARLAFSIGFDFVDLKQCHRYLLSELLAAKTRPGPYGGSFENRTRLVRGVIGRVRDEVPGAVVCSRINAYDGIPYRANSQTKVGEPAAFTLPFQSGFGTDERDPLREDLAEPRQLVGLLRQLGVPMVSISMGNPYANMHVVRPFEYPPVDGYETPEHPLEGVARHFRIATALQAAVRDMVLVGSGYSWLQAFFPHAAAANVQAGRVAAVGVGRAALPHPDFARALRENSGLDSRRVCRTFSYCTALMRAKQHELGQFPTGCPPFDKEVYGPIWKEMLATQGQKKES